MDDEVFVERCCGLDVHQATVVACLRIGPAGSRPRKEIRTFRTVRCELVALRDWLKAEGCTSVVMESTGVYWKPVYAVLEGHFDLIVGNAQFIKNVPGRKTDVSDSDWLSYLGRIGMIRPSFVPPPPIRELRDLMRYRWKLVGAAASERNRLLKVLESANIKLAGVASDVFGVSGRAMLRALIGGVASPAQMAQLARGRMRRKLADLELALDGGVEEHHRFLLALQLRRIEAAEGDLATLDKRIAEKLVPYEWALALLMQIPGVDMSVFLGAAHLASWAGICPGNWMSAGKRQGGKSRIGNVFLKTALVTAAVAASKKRGSYLKDKFHRLRARRGKLRAAVAIGHKILVIAYHMLRTGAPYQDLGPTYLDHLNKRNTVRNLTHRLHALGYSITLQPKAASPC
jgi:transposase